MTGFKEERERHAGHDGGIERVDFPKGLPQTKKKQKKQEKQEGGDEAVTELVKDLANAIEESRPQPESATRADVGRRAMQLFWEKYHGFS